ncbi:MAG: SpoIIE family protein phosphatase [Thermodesulfobacteriota bacterium]
MSPPDARSLHSGIKWHHRLSVRLSVLFSVFSILIFSGVLGYNYYHARKMIIAKTEAQARNIVTAAADKVSTTIASVVAVTDSMALSLEMFPYDNDRLLAFIRASVLSHPDVFGSTVAFEPYTDSRFPAPYAPYFYKTPDGAGFVDLKESYDYTLQDWYQIPRELGRKEWSEPYFDEGGGNILMATYSVPFYEKRGSQRRFAGIVTADISLGHLTDIVSSIRVLKTGYGFLLSRNGVFLAHPRQDIVMNESVFSLAEERNDQSLREMGRRMAAGQSGFIPSAAIDGAPGWMYYAPLGQMGGTIGVVFPEGELLSDIRNLTGIMASMGLAGVLLLALVVVFISGSITRPIRALADSSGRIAAGDFDAGLPEPRSRDEIGVLTRDFRTMRDSLKDHIRRLTETTAARERMESELKIAHDIQMSILPKTFPPFPTRDEFDLYALIAPAREVGGDFYDFFQLNENTLCFVIGDVSGKGVPAALFMAITKTLIKSFARGDVSPDEILSHVNGELAADNEACMFVTLFCGLLDMTSGEIRYANAGHNPPVLIKRNGGVEWLPRAASLVAGAMPEVEFQCERLRLGPGDNLFLYTDGVTEAMNKAEEFFSEESLIGELAGAADLSIREAIEKIMNAVHRFSDGAPQSDDITMMMIRYSGGK